VSAWKKAESDMVMTNPARRETEDETKEECLVVTVVPMIEGKPLVLLQVKCRSIYNKTLDFWNLIDIYDPDVVIGTESWLSEEISNANFLGLIRQLSEEANTLAVMEFLFV
jgi:hypothetical protein